MLAELGSRLERTRLERNVTQQHLADQAGVGISTLKRLEGGGGTTLANTIRVLRALELLEGLELAIPEPAASPIERLKLAGRRRRRASGAGEATDPDAAAKPPPEWHWGDETRR